jgi:hypothetical protein
VACPPNNHATTMKLFCLFRTNVPIPCCASPRGFRAHRPTFSEAYYASRLYRICEKVTVFQDLIWMLGWSIIMSRCFFKIANAIGGSCGSYWTDKRSTTLESQRRV